MPGAASSSSRSRSGESALARLDPHGLRVPGHDRHAHARDGHRQVRQLEDLARLVDELQLLVGVAVVAAEGAGQGQHVVGDRRRVDRGGGRLAGERVARLLVQRVDRLRAGAGHRLVGRDGDVLEAGLVADRAQHRHELHGRAVRVRDQAAVPAERVRVDVGHDQRHVGLHAEGRRVVDDDRAALDGDRRPLARARRAGREDGEVDAVEGLGLDGAHLELLVAEAHARAGAAGAGEADELAEVEAALGQHLAQDLADGAGGAEDGNAGARHGRSPPPGARRRARRRSAARAGRWGSPPWRSCRRS